MTLTNTPYGDVPCEIIPSVEDLPDFKNNPVFSDIETGGLYTEPRLFQFYCPKIENTIYIVDIAPQGYDEIDYEIELARAKKYIGTVHTVWYNSSYDLGTLDISPDYVDDLFYATKTAYAEFQDFGLAMVTGKYHRTRGLYTGLDKKALQKAGFKPGAYLSKDQIKYASIDVLALAILWEDEKIQEVIQTNQAYEVDMLSQRYALVYQQNGLQVDRNEWEQSLIKSRQEVKYYTALLPTGLNVNSYKQVRAYLDTEQSDADALITYSLSNKPLAKQAGYIIKLKKYRKEVSYLESIDYDYMVTKFNVAGAISGRFTSSGGDLPNGFNSQQIPRQFQFLFKQPKNDTVVVDLDYSTLELRLACAIYGSQHMYEQLMSGEDLHTAMAMFASGKALHEDGLVADEIDGGGHAVPNPQKQEYVSKDDRQFAKGINFGYVFGMSAKTYVNYAYTIFGQEVSLEQSTKLRNAYFKMYPEFARYHANVWNNYKKPNFFVYTALGRRVKPRLGTDGINIPVQGSGAECTKLAVIDLVKSYPEALNYIESVVHDAIYLRVNKEDEDMWRERLRTAMVNGWKQISQSTLFHFNDIPMPVD